MSKNKLIIFDFDGVLVKTEKTTFNYYKKLLPEYGFILTDDDFKYKAGRKSIDFFKDVLKDKFDQKLVDIFIDKKRKAFLKDVKKYLDPSPGVVELLSDLQKNDLKMALGSQNEKDLIEKALKEFGMQKYFAFTTSIQDIKNKKPDPEVFLLVTKTLGFLPSESVVIEDSPHGIEAAKVGGFKSVGITTSFSKDDLKNANLVIDSLKEINSDLLAGLD